ncbi:MAG: hypothetical protein RL701_6684 [Pseudomonadota bacterium]
MCTPLQQRSLDGRNPPAEISPIPRVLLALAVIGLCVQGLSRAVAAQEMRSVQGASAPDASAYDETIRRALQEFSLAHWTEAKVLFGQAHALKPTARTLRGLGIACYESRAYVEAIDYFERALEHPVQPLTPLLRRDMERMLAQSRQFVSKAELNIEPLYAEVLLDGRLLDHLQLPASIALDPGVHEIVASARGYQTDARRVTAEGGHAIRVDLALKPGAAQPMAAAVVGRSHARASHASTAPSAPSEPLQATPLLAPAAATSPDAARPSALGPWIVIGSGAAVAIAGGMLLAVATAQKSKVEDPGSAPVWDDYSGAYRTGKLLFPLGAVLLGVGVAGVAGGLTWKLWLERSEREPNASLSVGLGSLGIVGRM